MSNGDNIKKFTGADIERYHRGLLSSKERHELEKAALDDPFLADALEGYAVAGLNVTADIEELKKRLAEKTAAEKTVLIGSERKKPFPWLKAAAMIVVLAGAGLLAYQFLFNKKETGIAQLKSTPKEEAKKTDTVTNSTPVSTTTTENNQSGFLKTTEEKKGKSVPDADHQVVVTGAGKSQPKSESKTGPENINREVKPVTVTSPPVGSVTIKNAEDKKDLAATNEIADEKTAAPRKEVNNKITGENKQNAAMDSFGVPAGQPNDDMKNKRALAKVASNSYQYSQKQQMNMFRGRVTDATNTGVPFANVTNVQDNVGTYTDANGNFTLTSPDSLLNVQVRSIGFENNNTQLRSDAAGNRVVMQEDSRGLSEVVISRQKPNAAARSRDANQTLREPEPADGWDKYDNYLANNLNVPEDYKPERSIDNSVQVSFEVDKNGEPVNIKVEKSLCSACDKEAVRLIKAGPKWRRSTYKKGRTTVTVKF